VLSTIVRVSRGIKMKKLDYTKIIAWSIVLGLFLGFILVKYEIHIISVIIPSIILLIIFIIATVIYFAFKELRHQQILLDNGRYDELIKHLTDKHEQLNGKMGYKEQYLVGIANCYNRMGNFEESLNYLEKVDLGKMDNKIKAGYYGLISSNLYFLNRSLNRAEELINKSRQLLDMPESILLQALIDIELNKKDDAKQLVEQYYKKATKKKYMFGVYTIMYIDEYTSKVSEKFMLGLYYKKIGDEEKSKEYFFKSANCSYKNHFSDISKELIK
jgi:tetratricopeptide (TPR) repeat protein